MTSAAVVVCAYTLDRWDQLRLAIASLGTQDASHEAILVIDHNDELYRRAQAAWPEITVVTNDGPGGLSGERNAALRRTDAEVVAFLDDDAWAEPDWLATLLAPFADDRVVAVGGAAQPIWPGDAPAVVPDELLWVVGCSYRGLPETLSPVRNVMGCSMAFRRAPLMSIGGFNPDTGRIGSVPIGCEETEACISLTQGEKSRVILYQPAALVHHHVTAARTRLAYVARRSWCEGMSKAAISRTLGARDSLSTESGYVARTLSLAMLRAIPRGPRAWAGAGAIGVSVAAAAAGYARGLVAPVSTQSVTVTGVALATVEA